MLPPTYSYFGFFSRKKKWFRAQKTKIRKDNLVTLNDFQKLLRDINWIRPYLKQTTGEMKPLFDILKGDPDPTYPQTLTLEGRQALDKVEQALSKQQATYCDYTQKWGLYILPTKHAPTAVLFQRLPLRWLHLPASPSRVLTPYYDLVAALIALGRSKSIVYLRRDPHFICVPFSKIQQDWLFQFSDNCVIALAGFNGQLDNHYPSDKILQFAHYHQFLFPKIVVSQPLAAALFTDGSSNGIASLIIQDNTTTWHTNYKSAQEVELFAVFQVLLQISAPFNLYSDSQYIIRALNTIENVPFIGTLNSTIQTLFRDIQHLICSRVNKCYFGHIRAHSGLPGPLT